MKTITVNQEIEEAVARMSDTEAAALFRALLLATPTDKESRTSRRRSEAGRKGAAAKWQNMANDGKKENEEEKEKNQKNKEEEKEPSEWLQFWTKLRHDHAVAAQLLNEKNLSKDEAMKYLVVWHHFLKNNKATKHWTGGYEDFKQNFWHWFHMSCNSPAKIQEKFASIQQEAAARRRQERQRQIEYEERRRREQEWEEHKKNAVPCPEGLLGQFD